MTVVVPVHIVPAPFFSMLIITEASWIVRLIFHGFELGLTHRVIIADPGSAVAGSDRQLLQEAQVAASNHGGAPILVYRQLLRLNTIAVTGLGNQQVESVLFSFRDNIQATI